MKETHVMEQDQAEGQRLHSSSPPPYIPAAQTATASFSWKKTSILIASKTDQARFVALQSASDLLEKVTKGKACTD